MCRGRKHASAWNRTAVVQKLGSRESVLFFYYQKLSTCVRRKGAEIRVLYSYLSFLSVFLSACNTSKAADWSFTKLYLKAFSNNRQKIKTSLKSAKNNGQKSRKSAGANAKYLIDCAVAQAVTRFSPQRPGFNSRSVNIGFVVNKLALGQALLCVPLFPSSVSFLQ
jgi:hypothetical protein